MLAHSWRPESASPVMLYLDKRRPPAITASADALYCASDRRRFDRAHAERTSIIDAIRHDDILALATSYHPARA